MSLLDDDDLTVKKVRSAPEVSKIEEIEQIEETKPITGLSSIEKSKFVRPEIVLLMNVPILSVPNDQQTAAYAIDSGHGRDVVMKSTIRNFSLEEENNKNAMLKGWAENLREIEEQVRQLLASPIYQQLQEIQRKGDPQQGIVAGIPSGQAATVAAQNQSIGFLTALDRLQQLEYVPEAGATEESSVLGQGQEALILPLAAALLMGGGLSIAATESISQANPAAGISTFVQNLQVVLPQINVQDIVPLINLMIIGPIYQHSWNEAVSNFKNHERQNYVQVAHKFAKDIIKMMNDPLFVRSLLVKITGWIGFSSEIQEKITRMIQFVLVGVALGLLYTVEVGKVQKGDFHGIEPEELRDLLLGKMSIVKDTSKLSEHEQLIHTLIGIARNQLSVLPSEDRLKAANILLEYLGLRRNLERMLDPVKVFDEAFTSQAFERPDKKAMVRV